MIEQSLTSPIHYLCGDWRTAAVLTLIAAAGFPVGVIGHVRWRQRRERRDAEAFCRDIANGIGVKRRRVIPTAGR